MKLFDATVKRYFRELKPCRGSLALVSALNIGAVACAVAAPEKLGELIQMLYDYATGVSTVPLHQTVLRPALLQEAMDTLMQGRTCFVIAHRLSTIVNSNVILVLDNGHIIEQGTHRELLARRGYYYRLYTSQYSA